MTHTRKAAIPLSKDVALRAAMLVEQTFPPRDPQSAYAMAAALNLLNAAVKTKEGRKLVCYGYIKGMVCCMFFWLLTHPVEGVDIYWDNEQQVAYIRVGGLQFSYHYVPLLAEHRHLLKGLKRQQWDGRQLQLVALSLMPKGWNDGTAAGGNAERTARKMRSFGRCSLRRILTDVVGIHLEPPAAVPVRRERIAERQLRMNSWEELCRNPLYRRRVQALKTTLRFHIWTTPYCDLRHLPDASRMQLIRYDGSNYAEVRHVIMGDKLPMCERPEATLQTGRLYYRPRGIFAWRALAPSQHLHMLAYYCNLKQGRHVCNLCLTYGLACYLGALYPELRFINILNFNRHAVHGRIYTPAALNRVPPHSKARTLKVWLVVDRMQVLRRFQPSRMPMPLLKEYLHTPDYLDMYRIVRKKGKAGLYAYSRFHLLPPVYRSIVVHGNFAHVTRDDGKTAVYSLHRERFVSGFVYDDIWYDDHRYVIFGRRGDKVEVIHDFVVW